MTEKASALTFLKEIYKWFSSRKMQPPLPPPLFSHKKRFFIHFCLIKYDKGYILSFFDNFFLFFFCSIKIRCTFAYR